MPISPLSLSVAPIVTERRVFTDPSQPGVELAITLQSINGFMARRNADAKKLDYYQEFVTGKVDAAGKLPPGEVAPGGVTTPNGIIRPDFGLCAMIARVNALHLPNEEQPALSFQDWVIIAERMPSAFDALTDWVYEFWENGVSRATVKNASAANQDGSSDSPINSEPPTTPT